MYRNHLRVWKHAAIVTNVTNSKNEIQITQTNSRKKDSTISYYGFDDCAHTTYISIPVSAVAVPVR